MITESPAHRVELVQVDSGDGVKASPTDCLQYAGGNRHVRLPAHQRYDFLS